MPRTIKRIAAVGLAAAALAAFGPAGTASAANQVPCNNNEFTKIHYHWSSGGHSYPREDVCWANAGGIMPNQPPGNFVSGPHLWVHNINSGNNVVMWKADGNWNRLPKWNNLHFPNHPGGVKVTDMVIL